MDSDLWDRGTRRLDPDTRRQILGLIGTIGTIVAVAGVLITYLDTGLSLYSSAGIRIISVIWLFLGPGTIALGYLPVGMQERSQAFVMYSLVPVAVLTVSAGMYFAGPAELGYLMIAAHIIPMIVQVYVFKRAIALTFVTLAFVGIALVVFLQPGWIAPPLVILVTVPYLLTAALFVGGIVERHDTARSEVNRLNATLQQRVDEQVEELAKLGQMRRFLSPQVADALSDERSEAILQPHRKEIAVFFSDLRHYTRFTVAEAPEDVLISLDEYYDVVCSVLQRHNATIGSFSGDGVMAFLNDPLPHADPPSGAVRIALELHDEMEPLVARWRDRGFELGYGVGIAMGYATLGLLGNDERSDYTAVGPVVNLASRLCGVAQNAQILVDHRTFSAIKGWAEAETLEPVALKGFPEPVPTYSVRR